MKKLYHISLIFNGILLLAVILQFIFVPIYVNSQIKYVTQLHQERRISLFEAMPNATEEIIFLGANHIEQANWNEMFQNNKIKNRGVLFDNTEGVLKRLDEVLAAKPAKIFLMIGHNDLSNGIKTTQIIENYSKILQKCREKSPKTRLYLQTLTPVLYELQGKKIKNEDLMIFNSKLKPLAQKFECYYIDIFTPLVGNKETNELDSRYTNDGINLTAAGYTRWKALIEQYINN